MGGKSGFLEFARDGGCDNGGGIFIPDIVLYDEYGTDSPLFAPHYGA